MASNIYGATALIGGGTGAVDKIDGSSLVDKDITIAFVQGMGIYVYVLDADSGVSESSPTVEAPDTNAGDKRWLLQNINAPVVSGLTLAPQSTGFTIAGGTASKTLTVTGDTTLSGTPTSSIVRSARTSNTILAAADQGTLIDVTSGTFTQTFTAAATLGNGWFCWYRNAGTGVVTLNPNSSETINGAETFVLEAGRCWLLQCDGSGFNTLDLKGNSALILLSIVTANNSATVDIETTFNSTYSKYLISVSGMVSATDGQQLQMLLKIGGSYLTSSTYVNHEIRTTSVANTYSGAGSAVASPSAFQSIISALGNVGGENVSFNLYIHNPDSTALQKLYHFEGAGHTSAGEVQLIGGAGCNTGTGALTGVRFKMSSGNITSGKFCLYGLSNT